MTKPTSISSSRALPLGRILQLRIALRYIEPPIWRRVLVRDDWLLGELHPVFVRVMGWAGYHLHAFRFGGGFRQDEYSTESMAMEAGPRVRDENSVRIGDVVHRKGQVFTYEYDFGDSWLHAVKVEKVLPSDPEAILPVCLAGARACPPEDCGSFPGYTRVLRVLAKAENKEDRSLRDWVGSYNPEAFDLAAVNRSLQSLPKTRGVAKN